MSMYPPDVIEAMEKLYKMWQESGSKLSYGEWLKQLEKKDASNSNDELPRVETRD